MNKWDYRFIKFAHDVASWSKDPNEGVGAVLVSPDRETLHHGYNGFPKSIADDSRLKVKVVKNALTIHAELNAVLKAPQNINEWTLYLTKPPCTSCATILAQKSPAAIYMPNLVSSSTWYGEQLVAYELLLEANIDVRFYEPKAFEEDNHG